MEDKDLLIQRLLDELSALKVLVEQQRLEIEILRLENKMLREENAELKKKLNKNSNNSSKPPSSDGFKKKPKNNREKTNKKSGGQKGHPGVTLNHAVPDEVVTLSVPCCLVCGEDLSQTPLLGIEKRQHHDIPPIKLHVTEYQAEKKACHCGHLNVGLFPEGVEHSIQYGPRIKGFALYLHQEQKIPYARCCNLLNDYYGSCFSEGSLFNTQCEAYKNLEKIEELIKSALLNKEVLHSDETGVRVNKLLQWLHVTSNNTLTFYHIHPKRGTIAMDEIGILPLFKGTLVHDHLKAYFRYVEIFHALCNAHHLRELQSFEEEGQQWAKLMREFLKEACHIVNEAHREHKPALSDEVYQSLLSRYKQIIEEGEKELPCATSITGKRGKPKQPHGRNLLHRLRDYQEDVLRFMSDFKVPFTNNQAERDLRMAKLKQKISGGFRSVQGAQMFARIAGYLSTLRKQDINIAHAMTALCAGQPILPNF
jgi:transposase